MKYTILLGVLVMSSVYSIGAIALEYKKKPKKVINIISSPIIPIVNGTSMQNLTQAELIKLLPSLKARL